ncbi:MAG: hypothetical protein AAF693_18255 [Bacteroidota bacterium]
MEYSESLEASQIGQVKIDNELFFKISNVDQMRPFFMSIVSDSNHWMFIGSNGGVSAGRKDAENALFPYYTDDKIVESVESTGSKTIFRVQKDDDNHIWEPFSVRYADKYELSRNLYKNQLGNKILFEEVNHDLNLIFSYQWNSSNSYGFIKKSKLINTGSQATSITLLDGIQNIMPYGVGSGLQNQRSNLVDAYKRSELNKASGIGIFALSAIIVDKAEPSEALKANIAWSVGLENPKHLLSSFQLEKFRKGAEIREETDVKAERGAYFISESLIISSHEHKEWWIIANVNQNVAAVTELSETIQHEPNLEQEISKDIDIGSEKLRKLNAGSDGLQMSQDSVRDTRHFSNSLFNIMRGGIFDDNYNIDKVDFVNYLSLANKSVLKTCSEVIDQLPKQFSLSQIKGIIDKTNDKTFKRLCVEYMPLKFSRRHGDPSRPWNQFTINTHHEDGSKILDYEGNWRDIFQNWEALAHSYPEFIEGMIFRFLNASTFDGYNPYRITKNGIDWERIEPDDPWSYIGYWGDHQIIYLLKFLEFSESHYPGKLKSYFNEDFFVYAHVPYRIKSYQEILRNPKDTIDFDHDVDVSISKKWPELGADSALLTNKHGEIVQVNLIEKLLASLLAKISNFIPEGGIWMNTQRPEWNDANNALVGNGASMVTLYYIVRFLKFFQNLLESSALESVKISSEVNLFLRSMSEVLNTHIESLDGRMNDKDRKTILDGLGTAASDFRDKIYANSFEGSKDELSLQYLFNFTDLCQQYLDHSLKANKRGDNLYHAYNLMTVTPTEVRISYLDEMLEGQVAVLSSGSLSSQEALRVLNALKASKLFREDQYSYMLYPDKALPGFKKKNNIPDSAVKNSTLLSKLVENNNLQILNRDIKGTYHFNGNLKNANDLKDALEELDDQMYGALLQEEKQDVLDVYEKVFNHKAFTGRSGTFFGYEGLGSIYWHMVSKLLVATQECCLKAINEDIPDETIGRLLEHYYEINEGIGAHKPPTLYGAFPTDPYSHTPKGKGAQQPGMTGQVKEDILCRFGELGIVNEDGLLSFKPHMLRKNEFLRESGTFGYINVHGEKGELQLSSGSLSFTYCQVPIVYTLSDSNSIEVTSKMGRQTVIDGLSLDEANTSSIYQRRGDIVSILVKIEESMLK